jgi:hypothetical protein
MVKVPSGVTVLIHNFQKQPTAQKFKFPQSSRNIFI